MSKSGSIILAVLAMLCSACGQQLTCDSPQPYQASIEVGRIQTPEGLDELNEGKEMDIPRASPQDPRPAGSPCLDLPPSIQSRDLRGGGGSDDDEEDESDDTGDDTGDDEG